MSDYRITVLIPTYNRKDELLSTLKALSQQKNQSFDVIISDNCSDYSVENEILTQLPDPFVHKTKVFHHSFNIGGVYNIIGMLGLCDSEYGWILGDDDHVMDDAIDNAYCVLDMYPLINAFWFSVSDKISNDILVKDVKQLSDIIACYNNRGDFIFCSNKIYRISSIKQYMEISYRFSYTRISQCFPMIEMLKRCELVMVIGSKKLAVHSGFDDGNITWDVNKTVLGMCTIFDYPFGLDWKEHCELVKQLMFKPIFVLKQYLNSSSLPWNYRYYLKHVYISCFRYCYPLRDRLWIKPAFWMASNPHVWKAYKRLKGQSVDKELKL